MPPVAILAAGGAFPRLLAERLIGQGRAVHLLLLRGFAEDSLTAFPHTWVRIAQLGGILAAARRAGCKDLTFIGSLVRPALGLHMLPDLTALRQLPMILAAYRGGDDHLLSAIGRLFEREGFRLVGVHEWMPELLAPLGQWGGIALDDEDRADLALARAALAALGPFDVGQALIISHNHIVAIEGVEGTDGLLQRIAQMRQNGRLAAWRGRRGLLVKAPKPGQEQRLDLPAIGPRTIDHAKAAGLKGLAVAAGQTLVLDMPQMLASADAAGLALFGFGDAP